MYSTRVNKLCENGNLERPVRTIRPGYLAEPDLAYPYGNSVWHRTKTLWATLVAIWRESRQLQASLRAKAGYSGFRED